MDSNRKADVQNKVELQKGVYRQLLAYTENYTLTKMWGRKGTESKTHDHPHEQVIYILSGEGQFQNGDEFVFVKSGDTVMIASNVPHAFAQIMEDLTWLEYFTPERKDITGS